MFFQKACDTIDDCPNGEDEIGCEVDSSCPGMLYCKEDKMCIHPHNYCDGITHCPLSLDDEFNCADPGCPSGCRCLGKTTYCSTGSTVDVSSTQMHLTLGLIIFNTSGLVDNLEKFPNILILKIYHVTVSNFNLRNDIGKLLSLRYLLLDNTGTSFIMSNAFVNLASLSNLYFRNNQVKTLAQYAFSRVIALTHLNLSGMSVEHIHACAFCFMTSLLSLDLSYNHISYLSSTDLLTLNSKPTLNITGNPITHVDGMVHVKHFRLFISDNDDLCCFIVPSYKCTHLKSKAARVCGSLLPHRSYIVCWFIFIFVILIANLGVMALHIKSKFAHVHLIQHFSISDLRYSLYLLSVIALHYMFGEQYVFRSKLPQMQIMCKFISTLLHVSLVMSRMSAVMILINYLLVTKYALSYRPLTKRQILLASSLMWIVSSFTFGTLASRADSISPLCTTVNVTPSLNTVSYVITITLVLYLYATIILIACIHVYYVIIKYTNTSAKLSNTSNRQRKKLTVKAGCTVIIYSFTTSAVMALEFGKYYGLFNDRVKEYQLATIISLDSVANPFLYTLFSYANQKINLNSINLRRKLIRNEECISQIRRTSVTSDQ